MKNEESKAEESEAKSAEELNPLIVIVKGLPIVAPQQGELVQQALIAIVKKRCDVPMYPEHLQLVYEGEGGDEKTTGVAYLTIDTIDKARRVAIFFDEYQFDKKHKLDTSSSLCIKAE